MNRRILMATLFLASTLAHPALSAEDEKKKDGKVDAGQYVELQPVGLPIVAGGRLVNYVFVYVRINLTSSANASRLREKEPFFRDAMVRAAHRTPFTLASDLGKIDQARLIAAVTRDAIAIAGPGQCGYLCRQIHKARRRVRALPAGWI